MCSSAVLKILLLQGSVGYHTEIITGRYLYRRFPCFVLVRGTSVAWHADDNSPARGEYPMYRPALANKYLLPTKAKAKLEETDWTDVKAKKRPVLTQLRLLVTKMASEDHGPNTDLRVRRPYHIHPCLR